MDKHCFPSKILSRALLHILQVYANSDFLNVAARLCFVLIRSSSSHLPLSAPNFRTVGALAQLRCARVFLSLSCTEVTSNTRIGNLATGQLIAYARQLPYIVTIDGSVNRYVRIYSRTTCLWPFSPEACRPFRNRPDSDLPTD